ncbi:MAG: hypothetical protein IRY99_10460 [Isosphaeraceae bacterium]|nr:hypothetical protein [Isosphaeraceae bacterium]
MIKSLPRPPALISLSLLALAAGCGGEPRVTGRPKVPPVQAGGAPSAEPEVKLRPVIGQKTTDIKDAATEIQNQGAQISTGRITAKDPITLQGNAYVSIVGQASVLQIQHALDLYYAQNERYPKDLNEFMNEIIKPNGIALPQLPAYQEYGYDAANHRLVVLEYPDRKEKLLRQMEK